MAKLFWNVMLNIVIPSLLLVFGSKITVLGAFILAIFFPFIYGILEYLNHRKTNIFSLIGLVAIGLTGGIGLLELSSQWIVVKEAGVPLIIGVIILWSQWSGKPFVRTLFKEIMDLEKIDKAFRKKGRPGDFEEQLAYASYFLAGAFLVSAILNYVLAKSIIISPTGTQSFNEELGKMTALSFPVIAVPMFIILFFILFYLFSGIKKHTNLDIEDLMKK